MISLNFDGSGKSYRHSDNDQVSSHTSHRLWVELGKKGGCREDNGGTVEEVRPERMISGE